MTNINLNLPGWPQVVDEPKRKVFKSGDGYKLELDTSGAEVDIEVQRIAPVLNIEEADNE